MSAQSSPTSLSQSTCGDQPSIQVDPPAPSPSPNQEHHQPAETHEEDPQQEQGEEETTVTPIPVRKLAALTLVLMNESISASMLFPFVGFYVAFLTGGAKEEAGYTSGLLLSMFMLGQFLSGKLWGRLSDEYGRRPVMLNALALSGAAVVLFGCASSLPMAMLFRFFHGLVNGNIAIAKVVVAELTDRTNESKGFAVIGASWCVGCLIGPALGGYLYDPTRSGQFSRFPAVENSTLFAAYPALLPSVAVAAYTWTALAIGLTVLPETNVNAKPVSALLQKMVTTVMTSPLVAPASSSSKNNTKRQQSSSTASDHTAGEEENDLPPTASSTATAARRNQKSRFGFRQVFSNPTTRSAVLFYVLPAGAEIGFGELFPLWAITKREYGGLDLDPPAIGLITIVSGVAGLLATAGFPKALAATGCRLKFWQLNVLASAVLFAALPLAPSNLTRHDAIVVVVLMQLIKTVTLSWSFGTVYLFIAAVAPPKHLGAMNGIAQSSACMHRAVLPIILTPLYALSLAHPMGFLFQFYTTFFFCAALMVIAYVLSIGFQVEARQVDNDHDAEAGQELISTTSYSSVAGVLSTTSSSLSTRSRLALAAAVAVPGSSGPGGGLSLPPSPAPLSSSLSPPPERTTSQDGSQSAVIVCRGGDEREEELTGRERTTVADK